MLRTHSLSLAVLTVALSASVALAGGNGSTKANLQSVRIKNVGSQPVLVDAKNGASTNVNQSRTVPQNGVVQFRLKKIASQALAADVTKTAQGTLDYSFPRSQFVYLEASTNGTVATMTYAPPGKIF